MKKVWLIIIAAVLLYLPSLMVYFSGDDFFHLRISQINSAPEFINFFSFFKNANSASFYRPLPTQVFFFLGQSLFGLNPFGYHLVSILVFGALLFVVYNVLFQLTNDKKISVLALFFYTFSQTHFSQVYYLSALQELSMAFFYFSALYFWLKYLDDSRRKYLIGVIAFFVLALLCKETAVTFPVVAGLITLYKKRLDKLIYLLPVTCYLIIFLVLRLFVFGGVVGESYGWEVSPKIFNTLFWYGIWSIGIPEMFLDYIGPGFHINPNLWLYYAPYAKIILPAFVLFLLITLLTIIRNLKENFHSIIHNSLFFILTLSPLLLLPWHKFPLELSVPMFFVSLLLASLFNQSLSITHRPFTIRHMPYAICILALTTYSILNITSYVLTYRTHWLIRRGEVAQKVINYFKENYPKEIDKPVYFYNDSAFITDGWGASKHIWISLSGPDALNVLYGKEDIKVFYEDVDGYKNNEENLIKLGSKKFLGY